MYDEIGERETCLFEINVKRVLSCTESILSSSVHGSTDSILFSCFFSSFFHHVMNYLLLQNEKEQKKNCGTR